MAKTKDDVLALVRHLDREACVRLLRNASIQFDDEDDATLRTAVEERFKDDTLDEDSIIAAWDQCAADGPRTFRSTPGG